jgi:hypothetical protein
VVALLAAFLIAGYAGAHSLLIKGDLWTNRFIDVVILTMAVKLTFLLDVLRIISQRLLYLFIHKNLHNVPRSDLFQRSILSQKLFLKASVAFKAGV